MRKSKRLVGQSAALRATRWFSFDPDTRHIRQNVYLRLIEKQGGKLVNKEIQTFDAHLIGP